MAFLPLGKPVLSEFIPHSQKYYYNASKYEIGKGFYMPPFVYDAGIFPVPGEDHLGIVSTSQ